MTSTVTASPRTRRVRRAPEEARQEILDAAAFLLDEISFRDLTIDRIMQRTKIGRSAFYVYFKDIFAVVEELLARIRDEELEFLKSWAADEVDPSEALRRLLSNTVDLWMVRGPMISSMLDAAASDARIAAIFQEISQSHIDVVSAVLKREQAAGRVRPMDCDEAAALLVISAQAYLKDRLGKHGRRDALKVGQTLQDAWGHAVFGRNFT